jgi:surface polysaccharide O-acyltransferase-like enzyme
MRHKNIDALKILAALGVISLHVGPYPEFSSIVGNLIGASFRWCVPFFFMASGYFLSDGGTMFPSVSLDRVNKITTIFVIGNIVFLPVLLLSKTGMLDSKIFIEGTFFHLWYLSALIISLLVLHVLKRGNFTTFTLILSIFILVAHIAANYAMVLKPTTEQHVVAIRVLIGIPLMVAGAMFHRLKNWKANYFALLLLLGVAILAAEIALITSAGGRAGDAQFLLSSFLIPAGMLGLALVSRPAFPGFLGQLGDKESLGLYIYHPAFILIFKKIAPDQGLLCWIFTASMTLAFLIAGRRMMPSLRKLADGDLSPFYERKW